MCIVIVGVAQSGTLVLKGTDCAVCVKWLFFFSVADVVTRGRAEGCLEVGYSFVYKDVVPLEQLTDIAVVDSLLVEVGQYLCKVCT